MNEMLFNCKLLVTKFSIKKNSKQIFRNPRTGRPFITASTASKSIDLDLVQKLIKERLKQRLDTISTTVEVSFKFYFPKSIYFTKKCTISNRVGDLSNLIEGPQDCLEDALILENDRLICSYDGSRRLVSPDNNYYLEIAIRQHHDLD